jgi:hypothetical protein
VNYDWTSMWGEVRPNLSYCLRLCPEGPRKTRNSAVRMAAA